MKRPKIEDHPKTAKKQSKSKSDYGKYKCQYKQKSILTKLNSDAGYPQDILQNKPDTLNSSNYIQKNKHNLKNFFKDRIPPENNVINALMKLDKDMVHPKRIFQIKQLQHELKSKTRMNLRHSFQAHVGSSLGSSIDKLNQNFHINDKTQELKLHYGGNKEIARQYDSVNFRRGTQSHIEKRSKILKKEAYDKVFGPDISSMSRTAAFSQKYTPIGATPPRPKSISLSPFEETNTHKHLRQLISKMHEYKNKLDQSSEILRMGEENQLADTGQQNMIKLIQNMTKLYQERTVNQGIQKIQNLQDIAKLSKDFYIEMLQHKNHRLNKRRQFAHQTLPLSEYEPQTQALFRSFRTQRLAPDNHSQITDNDMSQQEEFASKTKLTQSKASLINAVKHRFQILKKTLVKWAALFYVYGISKENIFSAFRINRDPYELEGSYAFFKCIKLGDIPSIKIFLNNNPQFVFELEFNGKTPLSYAAFHNQTEVAKLILEVGVNSDLPCHSGHTSLYYAISKRNTELVKRLLQKGACPWSTDKNPYSQMIRSGENSSQLQILFSNARKIYLSMQIQPTISKRKEYWKNNFSRIIQTRQIFYRIPS